MPVLLPALYAMGALVTVTDLSILVGGTIASRQHEAPQNPSQPPEEVSQDPEVLSKHLSETTASNASNVNGRSEQELDQRQKSTPPAKLDVEFVITEAPKCPTGSDAGTSADTDADIDTDTDADTVSVQTLVDKPKVPSTPEPQQVAGALKRRPVKRQSTEEEDQAIKRLSGRKRRASSITSESETVQNTPSPMRTRWTGKMVESPVAKGPPLLSGKYEFIQVEPLLVSDEEAPASKRARRVEGSPPWVEKFRGKLSNLRPSKYSRRFRKKLTTPPRDDDNSA